MERLMNTITYVFYDELRHEIVTGHESGSIVIWNWYRTPKKKFMIMI